MVRDYAGSDPRYILRTDRSMFLAAAVLTVLILALCLAEYLEVAL